MDGAGEPEGREPREAGAAFPPLAGAAGRRPVVERALGEGRVVLSEPEAAELLAAYGVPQPRETLAATAEAAVMAARRLGYPVVLKACSPDLLHKSDAGGVRLGLGDDRAVGAAFEELRSLVAARRGRWLGGLVQEQVAADLELIVGARFDAAFGPVVLVGFGGTLAEMLEDRVVRLAPVDPGTARRMLAELRGARLLTGYRGRPPADLEALAELIVQASRLASETPIEELDLNPVLARLGARGVMAVDRRLILRRPEATPRPCAPGDAREAVRRLLNPASVAVVGASRDAVKIGSRVLRNLTRAGFAGRIFAVNPRGEAVLDSVPTVKSVGELPRGVDLACVAVPPEACETVIRACGAQGIPSAIVFTSGFAEAGQAEAERRLVEVARGAGVRFCGPNTLGILNPDARFYGTFSGALAMTPPTGGEIAYLSQSGALGGAFMTRLWEQGIGICRFVSVGNQADLDLADYVDALVEDTSVRVLALFVEGVADGRKLGRALGRARERGKPVVVYKAGRTREGQSAIRSHTGALAGDDVVWAAALREAGAVRATDMQTLFDAALALAWQPRPGGRRVGIVSTSGGACGILADECRLHGFEVPELPAASRQRVEAEIPSFGASRNPIDVTAQMLSRPQMFRNIVRILGEEPGIDVIVLMLTTLADPVAEEVAEQIAAMARDLAKPVLASWIIARSLAAKGMARLMDARIPLYDTPERAVRALAALADWPGPGDGEGG
jgi:acyl-CoA synthetase (NDP forming)